MSRGYAAGAGFRSRRLWWRRRRIRNWRWRWIRFASLIGPEVVEREWLPRPVRHAGAPRGQEDLALAVAVVTAPPHDFRTKGFLDPVDP
jgi:hypothetical protein